MTGSDEFTGAPWNATPSEEWNQLAYWDAYYQQLLSERDPRRRQLVIYREIDSLTRMLDQAGWRSRKSSTFLDSGCGISLIPQLLAHWGFTVTAIDLSPAAIEVAQSYVPTEDDLARCIPVWDPLPGTPNVRELVNDPLRSLELLRQRHSSGGSVTFQVSDWFARAIPSAHFDWVYCRNSLRCSIKSYWRKSLQRFYELLTPSGVLLLENVNAIGVQQEVEALLVQCGFVSFPIRKSRSDGKCVIAAWPTG